MNDLVSIQNSLPAELRAQFAAAIQGDLARLGSAGGGDQIRLSDKKFTLPDGTEINGPLSVVIVDFVYYNAYYMTAFNAKNITPPACFSLDESDTGMAPSGNSPIKQHDSCNGCQQNEFGSHPQSNGKACQNRVLLAVVPVNADATTEVSVISVMPTAIKNFKKHVATVGRLGAPLYGVISQLDFDPNSNFAKLTFDIEAVNENWQTANNLRETARRRLMQEPDVSGFEMPKGRK